MGQMTSNADFPPLLHETQVFAWWTIADVKELAKKFRSQVFGFALVEAQFECILASNESVTKHVDLSVLFDVLDNDNDGRIDGLELLAGLGLCCKADFDEKARFCFELFDFNLNASLSKKELIMMMMAALCGLNLLTGGDEDSEPDLPTLERLAADAFTKADKDKSGSISYEEFVLWARSSRDMMATLDNLSKLSDLTMGDSDMDEILAPIENDIDISEFDAYFGKNDTTEPHFDDHWLTQIYEPTTWRNPFPLNDGPVSNLELKCVFGVCNQRNRNNVRMVRGEKTYSRVVYPAAAVVVIYDTLHRTQTFYQGHDVEILCLAVHPDGHSVASADTKSFVHIWDTQTLQCNLIIKSASKEGVQHILFSPSSDHIVTVAADAERTLTIHSTSDGTIVSSFKGFGRPNNIYDIAFSANGSELCAVGNNVIRFFRNVFTHRKSPEALPAKFTSTAKKQLFLCVSYCEEFAVVGCVSGELYKFLGTSCIQVVQAHGLHDAVLSIYFSELDGVLVTGGADGFIKTWNSQLKEIGEALDMSEDLDGDGRADNGGIDNAVTSIQIIGSTVLIATKGCDCFVATLPSNPNDDVSMVRLATGHCRTRATGLACHPTMDEFVTTGDDCTLRVWSIRNRDLVTMRILPNEPRCVAYDTSGGYICVGLVDGSIVVCERAGLRIITGWKHSSRSITDMKYSPIGSFFAASSEDGNIYIYSVSDARTYVRQAVCRGHHDVVNHLDFSSDGRFIQSNGADGTHYYWDMLGNQVKAASSLRDTKWSTWNCVFGWPVQGAYEFSDGRRKNTINCCDARLEAGVLAVGDSQGSVKLYKYPSVTSGSLHKSYAGHGSRINGVKFSHNNRHLLTLGDYDRSVLLWSHENEAYDSSEDESDDSNGLFQSPSPMSLPTVNESTFPVAREVSSKSWLGSVVEPSGMSHKFDGADGSTDVDIQLEWIHGYRCHDCFNNVLYNSSGDVVYIAARVCVVYSRLTGKQRFLRGAHSKDIIGISAHPGGRLFATADDECIIVWDSETLNVVRRLDNSIRRGITLVTFSCKGDYIYTVGKDADNTLSVYDWAKGACLLTASTSKSKINCLCPIIMQLGTSTVEAVIVGGHKYLNFIWNYGHNIKSQKGLWGHEKQVSITALASSAKDVCVSGTSTGDLLIWYKFRFARKCGEEERNAHSLSQSSIQTIWCSASDRSKYDRYISGDCIGQVMIWNLVSSLGSDSSSFHLECLYKFSIGDFQTKPVNLSISTICERNEVLLIGTQGNEVYEVPCAGRVSSGTKSGQLGSQLPYSLIVSSHASGELWGLSMHKNLHIYATSGDDCYVRFWTLNEHTMLQMLHIGCKSRCICISPAGDDVAIGLNSGKVLICKLPQNNQVSGMLPNNLKFNVEHHKEITVSQRLIQIVKYSFDGSILAVGSHDSLIYTYSVRDDYRVIAQCKGHASYITHIDFGIVLGDEDEIDQVTGMFQTRRSKIDPDDIFIQSNCAANELRYWRCSGVEVFAMKDLKQVSWATCTCTRCWSVQGVWPIKDTDRDICAVSTSNSWRKVPVLGACDEDGAIRILNYPCLTSASADKCYSGHSAHVTNIGFSCNDSHIVSVGGNDKCVFVWATDIIEELRERSALAIGELTQRMDMSLSTIDEYAENKVEDISTIALIAQEQTVIEETAVSAQGEKCDVMSHPWKSVVREPSVWSDRYDDVSSITSAVLELSHVYGYRGWDCRNNIMFCDGGTAIAYHIAGVGIVHNVNNNTQVMNVDHDSDLSCISVHPEGHIIATGEVALRPKIMVWDARTGATLRSITCHNDGISHVSFSSNGSMIISVGMETCRTVAVHNARTGTLIGAGKIGADIVVHALCVNGNAGFLTGGRNHIKFWDLPESSKSCGELSSKAGLFGRIRGGDVLSAIFLNGDAITGMSNGSLILWKGRAAYKTISAHSSSVTSISNLLSNVTSNKIEVESVVQFATGCSNGRVFIWNGQLERIWSFDLSSCVPVSVLPSVRALALKQDRLIVGTSGCEIYDINLRTNETSKLVDGHFGKSNSVNGLAHHPDRKIFATCGDDMTVRIFNSNTKRQIYITSMESKARSVAYSPDGYQLAVGLHDGMVKIISEDLSIELSYTSVGKSSIEALAYSPSGHMLAVGSNDCRVYLLDSKNYFIQSICKGHESPVVQIDFSCCGNLLQTASVSRELRFWKVDGSPVLNATATRDVEWQTWTSVVGWPVQGLWMHDDDNVFICADRAPNMSLLLVGDNSHKVHLYSYPVIKDQMSITCKGHAANIKAVKFAANSKSAFSIASLDKAIIQYNVKAR